MSQRWEAVAAKYDEEKPKVAAAARTAPGISEQARQYTDNRTSAPEATQQYRPDEPRY